MAGESALFKKVYGCLLGGIIGDAMGAPAEGKTYQKIAEMFGYIEDFEGQGTDDSAIKMILCEAIEDGKGYVTADEFARSFMKNKNRFYKLFYIPVLNMVHKIESKLVLPVDAGYGNMQSSSSGMSISPMGLINAFDPRRAAMETYDVAGLIHAGPSAYCRDGACALAAAVAEAMKADSTVESVLDAAVAYLHQDSAVCMIGHIKRVLDMAKKAGSYEAFREEFYATSLQDIISDSRETVPCTLALFYLANGDANVAIPYAANFGRDSDTIGTMVGAICGAFGGVDAIRPEWVKKADGAFASEEAKEHSAQYMLAEAFVSYIELRMQNAQNMISQYEKMK